VQLSGECRKTQQKCDSLSFVRYRHDDCMNKDQGSGDLASAVARFRVLGMGDHLTRAILREAGSNSDYRLLPAPRIILEWRERLNQWPKRRLLSRYTSFAGKG
jgi:hypothetical protein